MPKVYRRAIVMVFEHENENLLPTIADVKDTLCGIAPGKKLTWMGKEVRLDYLGSTVQVDKPKET